MKELASLTTVSAAFNTAAISTNTTTNGTIIDAREFEALMFVVQSGAYTDGNYVLQIQTGNNAALSDARDITNVTPTLVAGDNPLTAIAAANTSRKVAVVQFDRYVRVNIVSTGVTTGATVTAVVVLQAPKSAPTPRVE